VKLRNLSLQGYVGGPAGIYFLNGHSLYIENCKISGFHGGANNGTGTGIGIWVAPPEGTTSRLFVVNSEINDNGVPNSGGGIVVQPSGSGSARIVIDRSRIEGNTYGIVGNGTGTTGTISMSVTDSVVANNAADGISSYTPGGGIVSTIVKRSSSVQNGNAGIVAVGSNAFVTLSQTLVTSNVYGLGTASGGFIFSYQNNEVVGNINDLAPTTVITPK
jgi:hypothetical protein